MTTAFISQAEFEAANPQVDLSRYTSTTISGMLVTATVMAENFLDYSLAFEAGKTEKRAGIVGVGGDLWVFPSKRPIRALNSMAVVKGSFNANLTLSNQDQNYYDIIDDSKIIVSSTEIALQQYSILNFQALRGSNFFVTINYDAGYLPYDRPQDIVEAVMLYARDLFSRASNTSGASEISQGALSIKYTDTKGKSDFIKDAESILQNYQVVGY